MENLIYITTDMPDDDKIIMLEMEPDADTLIVIWQKLLCLAGAVDDGGYIYLTPQKPYSVPMLAARLRRPAEKIERALTLFTEYEMIDTENGYIHISNWDKYQGAPVEAKDMPAVDDRSQGSKEERKREAGRERQRRFRENHREKGECNADVTRKSVTRNADRNADVTLCNALRNASQDKENEKREENRERKTPPTPPVKKENKEEKKEKETEELNLSNERFVALAKVQPVVDAWNAAGLTQIQAVKPNTNRYTMLKARLNEYGTDKVIEAIGKIRGSPFLTGQNRRNWVITFDWFIRPNNFIKVLEGNFDERSGAPAQADSASKPATASYDIESFKKQVMQDDLIYIPQKQRKDNE